MSFSSTSRELAVQGGSQELASSPMAGGAGPGQPAWGRRGQGSGSMSQQVGIALALFAASEVAYILNKGTVSACEW